MALTVTTNNVPRDIVEAYELSPAERAEFDYLAWDVIDRGEDSATFFRYRGQVYDLGEFTAIERGTAAGDLRDGLASWNAIQHDSFFSGIVVRWPVVIDGFEDYEAIIVGRYCC